MENQNNRFMNPIQILKDIGVEEGMKIADLGCGSGYFSIPAAKIVRDKGVVFSVDVLESALESVRNKANIEGVAKIIKPIRGNLETADGSKIDDGVADLAILKNVLFQSKKQKEILLEAFRVLKSGGKLLLIEWNPKKMPLGPNAGYKVEKSNAENMANEAGFSKIQDIGVDEYHYGMMFKK